MTLCHNTCRCEVKTAVGLTKRINMPNIVQKEEPGGQYFAPIQLILLERNVRQEMNTVTSIKMLSKSFLLHLWMTLMEFQGAGLNL